MQCHYFIHQQVQLKLFINRYCVIRSNQVYGNDLDIELSSSDFDNFMKSLYAEVPLNYPKFFKMDSLSKLGFITSELLLRNYDLDSFEKDEVGVVIANSSASNAVDIAYYDTIKDKANFFPSPALFVYTLPNIMIGEICIKNGFYGENGFFISKSFDEMFVVEYVRNLFETGTVSCCIVGWVDFSLKNYNSSLFLVTSDEVGAKTPFSIEGIRDLLS